MTSAATLGRAVPKTEDGGGGSEPCWRVSKEV